MSQSGRERKKKKNTKELTGRPIINSPLLVSLLLGESVSKADNVSCETRMKGGVDVLLHEDLGDLGFDLMLLPDDVDLLRRPLLLLRYIIGSIAFNA